jgi:hypothetical protein
VAHGLQWRRDGRIDVDTEEGTFASDEVRFRVMAAPPGSLPAGWTSRDIGGVAAVGSASFDGTTFTVRGSGADIWGTADEFHYAYTTVSGEFEVTTRVASVENIDEWTKAGLMIRGSTDASSVHASLIATPTNVKGFSLQKRTTAGGTSAGSGVVSVAPPVWLRMVREGTTIIGAYRLTPTASWSVFWQEHMPNLPFTVLVGLAVTSHRDGALATAAWA